MYILYIIIFVFVSCRVCMVVFVRTYMRMVVFLDFLNTLLRHLVQSGSSPRSFGATQSVTRESLERVWQIRGRLSSMWSF